MNIKFLISSALLYSLTNIGQCNSSSMKGIYSQPSGAVLTQDDRSKLPQTGEGVKIVDDSEIYHFKPSKTEQIAISNSKKLGYVERKSYDAIQLLEMSINPFRKIGDVKHFETFEPNDTHLKKSASLIPLAFEYQPLSFINSKDNIGFAASMTWKNGWTGITQFFKYKNIGTCKYLKTNVALNGSAIRLSKERISFYINKKPAVAVNEGRKKDGFLYSVEWYDNDYFHDLTCAQLSFSAQSAKDTADLANLIDKE